jgi:hypothetical protein
LALRSGWRPKINTFDSQCDPPVPSTRAGLFEAPNRHMMKAGSAAMRGMPGEG